MSEGRLYLLTLKIEGSSSGVDLPEIITNVSFLLSGYSDTAKVLHKFKISGEPRVIAVLEVNSVIGLERILVGLGKIGVLDVTCTPLVPYETYAADMGVSPYLMRTPPQGLRLPQNDFYWMTISTEYPEGKTTNEDKEMKKRESEALLKMRGDGREQVDFFKVMAERTVHVFTTTRSPNDLDKFSLPIIEENGSVLHRDIQSRAIQQLDDYVTLINAQHTSFFSNYQ